MKTNRRNLRQAALLALPAALWLTNVGFAPAATYYWDIDAATPGAGGATPSDSWVSSGTTWSTSPNGSAATSAVTTTADDDLVFSAGTDATGTYTITLDDAQLAKSLTFRSGTATISGAGGGVITLGGTGSIAVNNGPTTTPLSAVIGANTDTLIAGTAGLTKSGVGTLTLNGASSHTFTGGLNANGGTLALDFSNLTTPTDFIASGNALSFGGGAIALTAKATDDTAQSLGNVTVNSGGGDFRVNPNNGNSTTITLGSLTTTASGGSLIIGRALSSGTGTLDITTTTDKDATGIYGGRVVFADGTANTGYDWATTETASPGPFVLSPYTGYTALDLADGTDTANSLITANATMTGNRTTNSLKFAPTVTGQTLTNTGFTLTLTSGGLLLTSGQTNMNITGGNITAGDGTAPADLVVHQFNPSQPLGVGITGPNLNNTPEITSNITDNNGQPVTLVKNGPGSLRILGTNTFTGGVIVNQGSVDFGNASLNNNPITFNANAFFYTNGTHVTSGGITLNNGCQVTVCNNNASFTVNADVSGSGGLSVANGGQGAITLNLNGASNTFTGPLRFTANNGTQAAAITVASLVDTDTFGTGNITFGAGTASSISHNFALSASASAPLTLNNRRFEMAGLNVNQQINNNSTESLTINNDMLVTGSNGKNIQFGGTGNITFAGAIGNHPTPTAPGTIPNAVRKSATSTTNTTLTLASVEGIEVGATITGATLTAGTTITAINPLTREITLSNTYTSGNNSNYNVGVIFTIPNVVNSVTLTKAGAGTLVLSNEDSSYTGNTLITAGVLEVTKLADTGENSSIGRGGSGSSAIGLGQGATLRHTGSTTSSTNRALGATTTGNNTGFVLESAGTAPVQFTNTSILAAGSNNQGRYYTLTGDNTGNNILAAQINNNGTSTDNTNIIKNGTGKWVLTNPDSSFTGAVFINNGILSTNSIKNTTVASPIGAGLRFTLGNGNNNGTLEYTGAGDSSNRDTRIGTPNTIPGTGGGSILNNGSGALTFTATTFNLAQTGITDTRTLTLGGDFTGGTNEIQGIIQDNTASTGVVNLEKAGPGTWSLAGANTYSGTTTVNGGILLINNTTGSGTGTGNVAVNSGTLGGGGSMSGTVTIGDGTGTADASLAPGNSIGAIETGNLTFGSDGNYAVEVDATGATADQTEVTGSVTIDPAATLSVNVTGSLSAGQKFFILVNDDVDAVSGTFASFGQDAVVGTFGGTDLKISYTGDSVGNTTTGGNDIVLYVEGGTTPYVDWTVAKGLDGSPGKENGKADDPDKDGKNNLHEFAFDGEPLSGANDGKVVGKVATVGGDDVLTLTLPVRNGATFTTDSGDLVSNAIDGVVYRIEGDTSLDPFADAITEVTPALDGGLPALSTGWTYRTFRTPGEVGTDPKAFLRAKVTSDTP